MYKKFEKLRIRLNRFRRVRLRRHTSELKTASRKPHAVPVITFAVLIVLTASAYLVARQTHNLPPVQQARIVIISHDNQKQIVPSREQTVASLLQKLNIRLGEGDSVEPELTTVIKQDDFRINVYRAVPVQVVDGTRKTFAFSAATTPRSIAEQTGQVLYAEDYVNTVPSQDFIRSGAIGEQVVIDRATPVNVDMYGTHVVLRTHAKTVRDLIKEKDIKLIKKDHVVPALNTPIKAGQKISFIRTGTKVETKIEIIDMPVRTINDNSLAYGTSAVRQRGSAGQQTVTYQVSLKNNVETRRHIIQKVVTKKPVTQIVVVGTSLSGIKGDMALAGISPGEYNSADFVISRESGWNPGALNGSGCAGLGQACPGSKLAAACPGWQNDPVCQLRFFNGYASRYGGWNGAAAYWSSHGYW